MFDELQMAPPDPILGLTEAFKADSNPDKINLSVGVYKDAAGKTPVFASVKKAEKRLIEEEDTKTYVGIAGSAEYAAAVQDLMFDPGHEIITSKRAATAQAPGGTGALRVAGDFLKKIKPDAKLWVSDPTWSNHLGIFGDAGFEIDKYPYYDAENKCLAFDKLIAGLKAIPEGDIVLLHGCCHNPSGMDPTAEQWQEIIDVVKARKVLPIVDFAYQGFGEGLDKDSTGMRMMCDAGVETLITSSFSKNFGLYRERVGALTVVCKTAEAAAAVISHVKIAIRRNFSNPPSHGAAIVTTILNDPELRKEWDVELVEIRERIHKMRSLFIDTLKAKGVQRDFSFIKTQCGMFSFSGLNKEQVAELRDKYAIYIVGSGRINVAGMTEHNMDQLCQAIADVL